MRLLFCGSGWLPVVERIAARLSEGSSIEIWDRARPLATVVGDVDVLIPSNGGASAEVIAAAHRLRLIQQTAAGIDGIDVGAARARSIPVCNAPASNHVAVAEHALFLLLALARRAPEAMRAFTDRQIGVPLGIELSGRTLGIVGMGRSGAALAGCARGLGMHVRSLGRAATADERRTFFASCDAFSIHCPLDDSTRGLVGAEAFAAMRPGALLVNCARGPIIDRAALEAALASDRLGGVALDVHWIEPADPDQALYRHPRVLAMPHVAGSTEEAFARVTELVIENLRRLEQGEPLLHRVA
jgi:phosphoglycerate dehydrogenase-like enzyme